MTYPHRDQSESRESGQLVRGEPHGCVLESRRAQHQTSKRVVLHRVLNKGSANVEDDRISAGKRLLSALVALTMIRRTITNPTLAAMSMAPNTESSRMLRSDMSF